MSFCEQTIQSWNDSEVYMIPRPVRQPQQIPPGANGIDTSTNGSLQYYDVRTDNKSVKVGVIAKNFFIFFPLKILHFILKVQNLTLFI